MTKPISCEWFREHLSARFMGWLDPIEEERFLRHRDECSECKNLCTAFFTERTMEHGFGWLANADINKHPDCLSDNSVNEYGRGKLTNDEERMVKTHIEKCFLCQDIVNGYIEHLEVEGFFENKEQRQATEQPIADRLNELGNYIVNISDKICSHIKALTQTSNLVGATLRGESRHIQKKYPETILCQELAEYGYKSVLNLRSRIEDNILTLIFNFEPLSNPKSIILIVKADDAEQSQRVHSGKRRAEFVFDYKSNQHYEVYISAQE